MIVRLRRFCRGKWAIGPVVLLLTLALQSGSLLAQGIRGTVTIDGSFLQMPTMVRDSLPESEVPGDGLVRQLADGTIVSCTIGEFCRWYRQGPQEDAWVTNQELRFTAWGGVRGLSATVALRGRVGTSEIWPRASQEFDALGAYLTYDTRDVRIRGGRIQLTNSLGYYNYDGAAVLWKTLPFLWVEGWAGWSLSPNIDQPRDGDLMQEADIFAPNRRGLIFGAELGARWGRKLAGSVLYQREIRTDRLALYTERLAFDVGVLLGNVSIDAKGKYDMAYADFNDAKLTITTPIAAGFDFSVQGRRYLPFFELWTIWGAFSPVAFNEATGAVRWSSPGIGLSLEAAGGYRKYEDTNAGAQFVQIKDYGWTISGRATWGNHGWYADGGYRAITGFGAVRYGGDLTFGKTFGPRTYVGLRGTSTQNFGEFRVGEQLVQGGGIDGSIALGDVAIIGSYTLYRISYENQPGAEDWTQNRAYVGLQWRFGLAGGDGI
ncbi:MAG: hypothetical protein P8Y15_12825 [Gemmatimonadales bacterium]|jgi:hypothetical protein